MRFRNKETGEIYADIDKLTDAECMRHPMCIKGECPLDNAVDDCEVCEEWAMRNPEQAAELLGYEVIPDGDTGSFAEDWKQMQREAEQEAKADGGKLEIDLVPVQIVRDIAEVRMYGTAKYGDAENWRKVELRRYINALLRHTLAFVDNPYSVDEESGIPHRKHMACNMAFIAEMMKGNE